MTPLLLASLFVIAQAEVVPPEQQSAPAAVMPVTGASTPTKFRAALELSAMSFPSGTTGGSQDLFGVALPLIGFDGGKDFGFELGAALRLRLFDDPPEQRSRDFGHVLRREDWDETSDFGQLLRELRIGDDDSFLKLRAGPLEGVTLGAGHLVSRYGNVLNPNYHPAGAELTLQIPAFRLEALASDVLAARLFALDLAADVGRLFSQNPDLFDRFHLSLSGAYDGANAGGKSPDLGMLAVDFAAQVLRSEDFQAQAVAGVGTRISTVGDSGFGASLGALVDGKVGQSPLGLKLEVRKQSRGFRQGFFGADYELARFAATGFSAVPVARELLPDSFSLAAEVQLELAPSLEGLPSPLTLSAGAERFFWGRTDADAAVHLALLEGKTVLSARGIVTGLEVDPRYLLQGELRVRVLPALYVLAYGGTVFFPEPYGTPDSLGVTPTRLVRGIFAGLGAGADFAR